MALASCVTKVSKGVLGPTLVGADTSALTIVVHGGKHEQGEEAEEPEHGEHQILVGDHTKTILIKGVTLTGKLFLFVRVLVMLFGRLFFMTLFIVLDESLLVLRSFSIPAFQGLDRADKREDLLKRSIQEIVIVLDELLGAFDLYYY